MGRALAHLMELRLERGPIEEDEALALLDAWAAEQPELSGSSPTRQGVRYPSSMPTSQTLLLFAPVALGLLVIPGPAVLYIVARSIDQGRAAGVASVLGIHTGSLVHVAAAAAGLSALLVSSSPWRSPS